MKQIKISRWGLLFMVGLMLVPALCLWITYESGISAAPPPPKGDPGQVAFWTPGGKLAGDDGLFWDGITGRLGIATTTPRVKLDVNGVIQANRLCIGELSTANTVHVVQNGEGRAIYGARQGEGTTSYGYIGGAGCGVYGETEAGTSGALGKPGYGVYGQSTDDTAYAGYFDGNTKIDGELHVEGETTIMDPVDIYGSLMVFGGTYFEQEVQINDQLSVYDHANVDGELNVVGQTTLESYVEMHHGLVVSGDTLIAGALDVRGSLTKGSGKFKIDHPLDPENKYLIHSFVESPDMKNIYDGIVVLDENGEAVVELPAYFEALNRDFRYQLTCIGGYAPVYVAEKISGNRFKIAGGNAGLEVSWQVTGIRKDAYANAHPVNVEEEKPDDEKGLYLYPEEWGQPAEKGIN